MCVSALLNYSINNTNVKYSHIKHNHISLEKKKLKTCCLVLSARSHSPHAEAGRLIALLCVAVLSPTDPPFKPCN